MEEQVLIGVPEGFDAKIENGIKTIIRKSLGVEIDFCVVNREEDFARTVESGCELRLVVAIDDVGVGNEYSRYIDGVGSIRQSIVIVPNRCKGSYVLNKLINRGIYNILFDEDVYRFKDILLNSRTMAEAAVYCGVDVKPAAINSTWNEIETLAQVVEKEEVLPSKVEKSNSGGIQIRKMPGGVTVTRLRASDAEKIKHANIGDNEVMSAFLKEKNDFDLNYTDYGEERCEFEVEPEWVGKYKEKLERFFQTEGLDIFQAFKNGDLAENLFMDVVRERISLMKLEEGEEESILFEAFTKGLLSYGRLDIILKDNSVTDIRLLNKDTVYIQKKGKWYLTNITFHSKREYENFIESLCTKNRQGFNVQQAQQEFMDMKTFKDKKLRFEVTHRILNTNAYSSAHLRIKYNDKKTAEQLIEDGYWTREQAIFCALMVREGKSFLICGGSGSGKTDGLNCLIEYLPNNICGVCSQISDELESDKKGNIEFQHTISSQGESKIEYTLRQLTTSGLKKNTKLYMIGEIKGDEASDIYTAANAGAQCIGTLHTDEYYEAFPKLTDLTMNKDGNTYSQEQLLRVYARVFDFILQVGDYKLQDIVGVAGWDDEKQEVIYDVYEFAS